MQKLKKLTLVAEADIPEYNVRTGNVVELDPTDRSAPIIVVAKHGWSAMPLINHRSLRLLCARPAEDPAMPAALEPPQPDLRALP